MKTILLKNVLLFCMISFLCACNNEMDEKITDSQGKDIEIVEDGSILKFKDQTTFDSTVEKLKDMNSDELKAWSSSLEFNSLFDIYTEAMSDVKQLDDSRASLETFRDKYAEALYFPEYKEDFGAYLPITKHEYAILANKKGNVMIGDRIENFIDIKNYEDLQKAGYALYNSEKKPELRAAGDPRYFNGDVINWYESPWENQDNMRMIKLYWKKSIHNITGSPSGAYFELRHQIQLFFKIKINNVWLNGDAQFPDMSASISGRRETTFAEGTSVQQFSVVDVGRYPYTFITYIGDQPGISAIARKKSGDVWTMYRNSYNVDVRIGGQIYDKKYMFYSSQWDFIPVY